MIYTTRSDKGMHMVTTEPKELPVTTTTTTTDRKTSSCHVALKAGTIMLDTGCRTSVGGKSWHAEMRKIVTSNGLAHEIREEDQEEWFRFGDGEVGQGHHPPCHHRRTSRTHPSVGDSG